MRALVWLLVLSVAVPVATAQSGSSNGGATLVVQPLPDEAVPHAELNATLTVRNTFAHEIRCTIAIVASEGVKASVAPTRLVVPPGGEAQAALFVRLPAATNITHTVTIVVEEIVSNDTSGRAPIVLRETLSVYVPPPAASAPDAPETPPSPDAQDARAIELRVEPAKVNAPFDKITTAKLIVRNQGPAIDAPRFEAFAKGYSLVVVPIDVIPANATSELVLRVRALEGAPRYDDHGTVQLVGYRVPPATFALSHDALSAPLPAPPPRPLVQPTPAAPVDTSAAEAAAIMGPSEGAPRETIVLAAAAAGVAGAGTGVWLTRRTWWPLLLALYTRLRPSKMLNHPLRRSIADTVQREPGIAFGELARAVGIAPGQLTHHARMLEKAGIVFSSPDGQTRRFFHVGMGRLPSVPPLAERALSLLRERPRHASELARDLGVSRQALHYHVKQLVAEGKLVARADGREMWLEPNVPQSGSASPSLARS